MSLSKRNQALAKAYQAGYRVNDEGTVTTPSGTVIEGHKKPSGYVGISVKCNGFQAEVAIHRLYAYQIHGEAIFDKAVQVRHLDGNPSNNKPSNIAIGSISDNEMDKPESVRKRSATLASHTHHDQSRWIPVDHDRYHLGMSYNELNRKYGIAKGTLSFRYGNKHP